MVIRVLYDVYESRMFIIKLMVSTFKNFALLFLEMHNMLVNAFQLIFHCIVY